MVHPDCHSVPMGPPSEAPAKRLEGKKTDVTDKNRRQPSEKRRVPGGPAKTHEGKNPPVPGEKILHLLVPEGQRSYEPSPIFPQPAGPGTKFEIFFRSQNSNLPTPASTSRPWRYLTMSDFQRSTQGGPFLGGSLYSRRTAVPGAVLPSQFLEASDATAVNRARPITNSFVEPVFITFQNQDFVLTECVLVCALKRYIHPGADKDNRGVGDKDGNDEGDVENSGGEPSTTTPRIAVVPSSSNLTPRQRQRQQQRQRQKAKRAQEKQQQQQQHKKEKPDMLDDDTVSEVLKAYRTTWAPINVTGLYDRLMDPQQPQREALEKWLNGSEEEMKKFALWWYRAWLNTMTAIYKRMSQQGLMDRATGQVYGSGFAGNVWPNASSNANTTQAFSAPQIFVQDPTPTTRFDPEQNWAFNPFSGNAVQDQQQHLEVGGTVSAAGAGTISESVDPSATPGISSSVRQMWEAEKD